MAKGMALTIGLNRLDPEHYAGWDGPLQACETDARDMAEIATAQGFQVRTLLTQEATRNTVLEAVHGAADTLDAGDIFLLSYSGHGGQLPDLNADEFDDGHDETWCLYDGQLVDDELYYAFGRFAENVRIVMFSDSCHSGTVARFRPEAAPSSPAAEAGAPKYLPPSVAFKTYDRSRTQYDAILSDERIRDSWQTIAASVLLISAVQDDQEALDGPFNGLFTGTLLRVWNRGRFQGGYLNFHDAIRRRLPAGRRPNYFKTGRPRVGFDAERPFTI